MNSVDGARRLTGSARLDLERISAELAGVGAVARKKSAKWKRLRREPLSRDVIARLAEGYRYIDGLVAQEFDLFGYGGAAQLLELNHIVLCGRSPETRAQAAGHIEDTRRYFYEVRDGGIGDFSDWYQRHRGASAENLAAGCFIRIVTTPQLFIEGNQRTASLIGSYILARHGLPPLVITRKSYKAAFRLFAQIKALDRRTSYAVFLSWRFRQRLVQLYRRQADARFLVPGDPS